MEVRVPNYVSDLRLTSRPRTPLEILNKAASRVSDATDSLVEATVATINPGGSTFRHTFYLVVPTLDDYTDPLFYAWHGAEMYPVNLLSTGGRHRDEKKSKDPEAFEEELGQIFESQWVRERMYAMIELAEKSVGRREHQR